MYTQSENIVTSTRKDCSQLFLIFTGAFANVEGMAPLDFLRKTGLANRNIVILRDPYMAGFRLGISEEIPDMQSLILSQHEYRKSLSHVRDVYCVGVSAGGLAAIETGHSLKAKVVWSFSPRPPSKRHWKIAPGTTRPAPHHQASADGGAPAGLNKADIVTDEFYRTVSREIGIPIDEFYDFATHVADFERVTGAMRQFSRHNGVTEYRLYCVPSNKGDLIVHRCLATCPGMVPCPVEPPSDYAHTDKPIWDHMVLSILNARGELSSLFPPFAAA